MPPAAGAAPPPAVPRRRLAGLAVDLILVALVGLVATAMRLIFLSAGAPAFVTPDSDDYLWPGYALAHGLGFEPELRRTPLYPFFIAAIMAPGGSLVTIVVVQHAVGVLTAMTTYLLGRVSFGDGSLSRWERAGVRVAAFPGRLSGLLAGLAVAVSGPLLIYEHYLMSEAFFTFVLTLALTALVITLRRPTTVWLLVAGALVAVTALTRPIGQVLVPLALILPVLPLPLEEGWGEGGRMKGGLRRAALVACGIAVVLAPWTIRNLVVHGTTGAEGALGQALIGRTVRHDKGFRYDDPARPDPDLTRAAARRIIQQEADTGEASGGTITARVRDELGLTQAQTSNLLRDLAVAEIVAQPRHYLATTGEMAWELFQGRNERLLGNWRQRTTRNWDRKWDPRLVALLDDDRPAEGAPYERADAVTSFFQPWRWRTPIAWLFGIGLLSALILPRYRPALAPALAAILLVLAAAALDGLVWRFRYPADPAIAVVAAGGLAVPLVLLLTLARTWLPGRQPATLEEENTACPLR